MIALIQRVARASVRVADKVVGEVGRGLLVFVCAERGDEDSQADALLAKVLACRVFADEAGRMNLSVVDVDGGLLLVPQFTLAADTRSGTRPSFSPAAPPELGQRLFERFATAARGLREDVQTGEFGAHMQVELVNDGPVTIWLQVPPTPQ
jgi:D-tyrosyl-tRNA(Tyr) deacylase